jgi:hypothetical protein
MVGRDIGDPAFIEERECSVDDAGFGVGLGVSPGDWHRPDPELEFMP